MCEGGDLNERQREGEGGGGTGYCRTVTYS